MIENIIISNGTDGTKATTAPGFNTTVDQIALKRETRSYLVKNNCGDCVVSYYCKLKIRYDSANPNEIIVFDNCIREPVVVYDLENQGQLKTI
jgi:hypothetical protein